MHAAAERHTAICLSMFHSVAPAVATRQVANFSRVPVEYQLLVVNLLTILGAWEWRCVPRGSGHMCCVGVTLCCCAHPTHACSPSRAAAERRPRPPALQIAASCLGPVPTTAGSRACSLPWLLSSAWRCRPAMRTRWAQQQRWQQAASPQQRRRRAVPRPASSRAGCTYYQFFLCDFFCHM